MSADDYSRRSAARSRRARADTAGVPHREPEHPRTHPDESPLAWLRRRRDKDGQPMIGAPEFEAGERLRADYTFGQLMPNITSRWSPIGGGDGRPRGARSGGSELRDSTLAARERVNRALDAVGPELAGILIDVCCHLKGLEDAERAQGWPLRSAKVVLQIALSRLARHYGLMPPARQSTGPAQIRHWGGEGYRPNIGPVGE
jgi:hypothetical protein